MGLIREPKEVDFSEIDKPWNDQELEELSAYIKMRKEQQTKRSLTAKPRTSKKETA